MSLFDLKIQMYDSFLRDALKLGCEAYLALEAHAEEMMIKYLDTGNDQYRLAYRDCDRDREAFYQAVNYKKLLREAEERRARAAHTLMLRNARKREQYQLRKQSNV